MPVLVSEEDRTAEDGISPKSNEDPLACLEDDEAAALLKKLLKVKKNSQTQRVLKVILFLKKSFPAHTSQVFCFWLNCPQSRASRQVFDKKWLLQILQNIVISEFLSQPKVLSF